ncbi:hypothetical protein HYFRA_00002379 [Hymenoscyphus fraxineus]|uniref:MFS general substrate transporter n=1 Tax=Hymenoscyphus fraxineus TaxID=746836 RepID=A0A9N9LB32_9HELO|nr:hypothetical protein HYFRA_00002379 [Hymenoscyphus fraxineus]
MIDLASIKIGSLRYNSPWIQVFILGFVCFSSVGMFSAIGGLGAGGTQDVALSDTANGVLYGCFAIAGFFAGSINNILGVRLTLSLGTTGYSLYIGSLWCYQVNGTRWFLIFAGGILGVTAALLWAAQGAVMMSYPLEKDKGTSFTLFWTIFQMGTLVGSAIALGIEIDSTLPSVSTTVYIVFMIIMLTAIFSSWLLLPSRVEDLMLTEMGWYTDLVVRGDNTIVELEDAISPQAEFREFGKLFKDWRMIALFPMFFCSNYFYAYQVSTEMSVPIRVHSYPPRSSRQARLFSQTTLTPTPKKGAITSVLFNGRTRALTALLAGLGSTIGSILIGILTDRLPFGRRKRAIWSWTFVLLLSIMIWSAGLAFQLKFTRADKIIKGVAIPWDWTQNVSTGPMILIMGYYIADAAFQGLAYYTMSSMSNNPFKLARMAGYYKGVQSAGAAISFGMDAVKTAYLGEILISWLLLMVSMPLCLWVLWGVRDTNYDVEGVTRVEDVHGEVVVGREDGGKEGEGKMGHTAEDKELMPPSELSASDLKVLDVVGDSKI